MSRPFSAGVQNFLSTLHPGKRDLGEAFFPSGVDAATLRTQGDESPREWFVRTVDSVLGQEPGGCAIEPQFGAFASVKWRNGTELRFVQIQAIVCMESLEQLYLYDSTPAYYLRLDYDLSALGAIFSHHHPHIHTTPWDFALRFPPDMAETGNVVVDFMDFIYRNFFHTTWKDWAASVWRDEARRRNMDNLFEPISAAFDSSKVDILLTPPFEDSLKRMKHTWRKCRDDLFPLRIPLQVSQLLSLNP